MSARDRLVYAIIKFLADDANSSTIGEEAKESIEVARQCVETAYNIQHNARPDLELGVNLEDLISNIRVQKQVTPELMQEAEKLKKEGNDHVNGERFEEAVSAYSRAIDLDNANAIYFSNRAAAYNKLNKFYEAVDDCDEAIAIDPNYSKAYGRKGLALSGLNQHNDAIENYKRAIELDPSNQNFKTNLEIAEEKARVSAANPAAGFGASGLGSLLGGGTGGMPDMAGFLNNPAMMNMATQMMQNPAMQQMMGNMMAGMQPPPTATSTDGDPPPVAGGMDHLLRAGQQIAEQMQQTNPDLVDQLRNQFQGSMNDDAPPPPPPPPSSDVDNSSS